MEKEVRNTFFFIRKVEVFVLRNKDTTAMYSTKGIQVHARSIFCKV